MGPKVRCLAVGFESNKFLQYIKVCSLGASELGFRGQESPGCAVQHLLVLCVMYLE